MQLIDEKISKNALVISCGLFRVRFLKYILSGTGDFFFELLTKDQNDFGFVLILLSISLIYFRCSRRISLCIVEDNILI